MSLCTNMCKYNHFLTNQRKMKKVSNKIKKSSIYIVCHENNWCEGMKYVKSKKDSCGWGIDVGSIAIC